MKYSIVAFLACILMVGCGMETTSDNENPRKEKELIHTPRPPKKVYEQGAVVSLEGIYATSTKSPELANQINNIFDENGSKYWSTMTGAAADEGFMLYFEEAIHIGKIILETSKGGRFAALNKVTIYGNGRNLGLHDASTAIEIDTALKSLYVRFAEIATKTDGKLQQFEEGLFKGEYAIGIRQLIILDENGKAYQIVPPKVVPGIVQASSTLEPASAYHAGQLFDSRREFVWVEGADNNGVGERLDFLLKEKVTITALEIQNGYQRSDAHYKANARVKSIEFGIDGGQAYTLELKDTPEPQRVTLPNSYTGSVFSIKVKSVYAGTKYKDLAISEMRFFNGEQAFVIGSDLGESFKKSMLKKVEGKALASLVDRSIKMKNERMKSFTGYQALTLRSNGTFVMYEQDISNEGDGVLQDIIADGNWEIIDIDENSATINVFGKFFNLKELEGYYRGVTGSKTNRIFKDELRIGDGIIKGGKFISAFEY